VVLGCVMFTVSIIGTGALGKTLGCLLVKHQLATIAGIYNRTTVRSLEGKAFIGEGEIFSDIKALPPADLILITTPDDAIESTVKCLAEHPHLQPGSVVVHCSGALSSDVLHAMKARGCWVMSMHPMRSFADPALSVAQYAGTFCAMEGDAQAIAVMAPLFEAIGAITYVVNKAQKALYHAAGVFASNYVVTLAKEAQICLQQAGVDDALAMQVIVQLMKGTVSNLEKTLSPEAALTGPIQRGDLVTLQQHLEALDNVEQKTLYRLLGKRTLAMTSIAESVRLALQPLFL